MAIESKTSTFVPNPDARVTLKAALAPYGLEALADKLYENYSNELVDMGNLEPAIYALRNEKVYKERFKANEARTNPNRPGGPLPELLPGEYVNLENQYKEVIRVNGLPAGFYDSADDTTKLIEGTVSPAEFQRRIAQGYNAVANADPEVLRQFSQLYGVSQGQLAAYFIDPVRGETLIKQQADAAKIAARASESANLQLTRSFAEDLASRGVGDIAAETFMKVGQLGELTTAMAGETALNAEQIVGSQAGTDTQAALELERRRRSRVAEFQGGGQFARTQGESAGAITTSVGTAQ
jgi:hypothetical protein